MKICSACKLELTFDQYSNSQRKLYRGRCITCTSNNKKSNNDNFITNGKDICTPIYINNSKYKGNDESKFANAVHKLNDFEFRDFFENSYIDEIVKQYGGEIHLIKERLYVDVENMIGE